MKALLGCFGLLVLIFASVTPVASQITFSSPDAAVNALASAVETPGEAQLVAVLGRAVVDALNSGGSRKPDWTKNVSLLGSIRPDRLRRFVQGTNRMVLFVGTGDPFALPILRTESGWRFDGEAGVTEVTKRRIRRNELAAIDLCYRYLDAQLDYASTGRDGTSVAFAQRINSSPGKRDGLFWTSDEFAEESPLGPVVARAAPAEHDSGTDAMPHSGYYFKVLLRQGRDAPGGALDYRVDGHLTRGFALVAWPAEYGRSGFHTFLINQDGEVYQKDLGASSDLIAADMTVFNPDHTWSRVEAGVD
jgi:hypothetical protein